MVERVLVGDQTPEAFTDVSSKSNKTKQQYRQQIAMPSAILVFGKPLLSRTTAVLKETMLWSLSHQSLEGHQFKCGFQALPLCHVTLQPRVGGCLTPTLGGPWVHSQALVGK